MTAGQHAVKLIELVQSNAEAELRDFVSAPRVEALSWHEPALSQASPRRSSWTRQKTEPTTWSSWGRAGVTASRTCCSEASPNE